MDRRDFITAAGVLTAGASFLRHHENANGNSNKRGGLKVAFLTDIHVKPTAIAEEGMRKAFEHVNNLSNKPDFIINGGDAIMDAMAADKIETQLQWDVWNKILSEENKLPMYHVIGNHDAWGWQVKDESIKSDPLYDKGWPVKQHGMPGRYYSFEQKNWKFIILDSSQQNGGGYIARIDDPQMAWLETELKNTSSEKHICIASHIPIVSFCAAMFFDDHLPNGDWKLSRALLHVDARKITALFNNFKNIRCCLSGHIHLQDVVQYKGIQYFCNGAVSGSWWNGAFKGFQPAYAVFNLGKDGSVKREMMYY